MKAQFNIDNLIKHGKISNELELEKALIVERKLRVQAKKDPSLNTRRSQLRDLIEAYESKNWSEDSEISEAKIKDSDLAETIAENERIFLARRKELIKTELKKFGLSQQEFGQLLGHNSKSYTSELMNGISPFTMKDLVIINRLFKISLADLIPTFISHEDRLEIKSSIKKLRKPNLRLSKDDFTLI